MKEEGTNRDGQDEAILDFGLQSSTRLSVSFALILTISVHPC
jgi:hypothetical protein